MVARQAAQLVHQGIGRAMAVTPQISFVRDHNLPYESLNARCDLPPTFGRPFVCHFSAPPLFDQYDFGSPSTFSAMKHRISCGLTGAIRGIITSRR